MLVQLSRRVLGFGVSTFALLGYLAVPLGDKTGFQHTKAVLGSDEAQRLGRALTEAAADAKRGALAELERRLGQLGEKLRPNDTRRPTTFRPTGSPPEPPERRPPSQHRPDQHPPTGAP